MGSFGHRAAAQPAACPPRAIKISSPRVRSYSAASNRKLREHPPQVEWFGWHTDPWYQDPDHPFVRSFRKAAGSVLGREVEIIGRAGGLDSRFCQYFDMASACTGPRVNNIHGIDEYVEIPSAIQVAQVLAMATLEWCGYQE